MRKKKQIDMILLLFSLVCMGFFIIKTVQYQLDRKEISQLHQQLIKEKQDNSTQTQINFSSLLDQNKDTIGWIQIPDTNIDYPVVQSTNNTYYLTHSFNRSTNQAGWIFADYRNHFEILNQNNIIYGHGRLDETMFGDLKKLLQDNWFQTEEHQMIQLDTPTYHSVWKIVSLYTISPESYYITTHFSKNEFEEFSKVILKRSNIDFDENIENDDKLLTLSTCYPDDDTRFVVHAKLIKKENYYKK